MPMKNIALILLASIGLTFGKQVLPLANGGFEEKDKGWQLTGTLDMIEFTKEAAFTGDLGLRLTDKNPKGCADLFSERFPAKPDQIAEITFASRSLEGSAATGVYLMCYDSEGKVLRRGGECIYRVDSTTSWSQTQFFGKTLPKTESIGIRIHTFVAETGQCDLDDLTIAILDGEEAENAWKSTKAIKTQEQKYGEFMQNVDENAFRTQLEQVAQTSHPRLFADAEEFQRLKGLAYTEGTIHQRMRDRLIFMSDKLLSVPVVERKLEGRRLLGVSRLALYRISTLGLTWKLTENPAYRDRCLAELRAIAEFSDWHPSHYLDVAEMTLAAAIGYDWLYDQLTPEEIESISEAILKKGLTSSSESAWWRRATNNWGQVCHTGMLAGAIAIADRHFEASLDLALDAVRNIAIPMHAYAPNGNYPEGPGYWEYGTGFNVMGLALMVQAFKTDFGLTSLPGFKETRLYNEIVTGPSGFSYNYADSGQSTRRRQSSMWWLAKYFKDYELVELAERKVTEKWLASRPAGREGSNYDWFHNLAFFWIFEKPEQLDSTITRPLVWDAGGNVPIVIMRNTWNPENMTYLGIKGGSPRAPHGHMDGGSFILDAANIRWIFELGAEGYHRVEQMGINLWGMHQNSERWQLFRLNTYGHSTLVIDGKQQLVSGFVKVLSATEQPRQTVLDMTGVYANSCSKAIRTFNMDDNGIVEIIDEVEGLKPNTPLEWGAITKRTVAENKGNSLVLQLGDNRFQLLSEDPNSTWLVQDVETPKPEFKGNSRNKDTSRLVLTTVADAEGKASFKVKLGLLPQQP